MTAPDSPIRLVLDTNVLLRALANRASASRRVVAACEARRVIALLSKPVLDEYRLVLVHLPERNLSISFFDIQAQLRKLKYLSDYTRHVRASFVLPRDPADAMLIELAIDARATHIVSYDADLLSLPTSRGDAGKRFRQRLRGTLVVRPEELIRRYSAIFP